MKLWKFLLPVTLCLVLALLFLPTTANAASSGTCGDNVTWTLDNAGTLTISGTGPMKDYTSSSYAPWYSNRSSVKKVVMADGVTTIADYAFYYCSSLTGVTIGNSVTTIGKHAFFYCDSLTGVTIPDSVTTIGEDAFCGCDSLTSVTIGNSVTTIDADAFFYCDSLTSVYISDLAAWCTISFANSFATPMRYAKKLYLNEALVTELVIPDSVIAIGDYAFYDCDCLKSVVIPDSVTTIGDNAFTFIDITSVMIPDSVTAIGKGAFANCDSLTSITVPDSVTTIGDKLFYQCDNLTSVTIGHGVTSIGEEAFFECTNLLWVYYNGTLDLWEKIQIGDGNDPLKLDGYSKVFGTTGENLYWFVSLNNYLVVSGTGAMPDYSYGAAPWHQWRKEIKEVILPDGITAIGDYAFLACDGLAEVTIPDSVTTIGDYAFYGTALEEVTIPAGVTAIGSYAFQLCPELAAIRVAEENPNYSSDAQGVLFNKNKTTLLAAPGFLLGDYTVPEGVTEIAPDAFRGCTYLMTVTVPESVKTIDDRAFNYCISLIDVYYGGTRNGWKAVSIGKYNEPLLDAGLHIAKFVNGDMDGNDDLSTNDAVYLLLHVMFGAEDYPVFDGMTQDLNADGKVDTNDAVYLLLHVMFGEEDYPLAA